MCHLNGSIPSPVGPVGPVGRLGVQVPEHGPVPRAGIRLDGVQLLGRGTEREHVQYLVECTILWPHCSRDPVLPSSG